MCQYERNVYVCVNMRGMCVCQYERNVYVCVNMRGMCLCVSI